MRTKQLLAALALATLAPAALAGCATQVDVYTNYRNKNSTQCTSCRSLNCAAETNALASRLECSAQAGLALACDNSGCYSSAITTSSCRQPIDAVVACTVQRCESQCR